MSVARYAREEQPTRGIASPTTQDVILAPCLQARSDSQKMRAPPACSGGMGSVHEKEKEKEKKKENERVVCCG
jgi:hypothetical protein